MMIIYELSISDSLAQLVYVLVNIIIVIKTILIYYVLNYTE